MQKFICGTAISVFAAVVLAASCGTDTSPTVGSQVSNVRGNNSATLKNGDAAACTGKDGVAVAGCANGNQTVTQCLDLAYELGTNPDNCIHPNSNNGDQVATTGNSPTPIPGSPTPTPIPGQIPTMRGMLKLAPDKVAGKDVWEFTVPAGTANKPWNTTGTVFELKIGEVFRMRAAEGTHGFHVDGGSGPCRHGGNRQYNAAGQLQTFNSTGAIAVGGYFECDVATAVDTSGATNSVYDHIQGTGARIFFKTIP